MTDVAPRPPFHYDAFGLIVASDVMLSELQPCEATANVDLEIRRRPVHWPGPRHSPTDFQFRDGEQFLHWDTVGTFRVPSNNAVDVSPNSEVDPSLLSFPILGPIMALVLHRRGFLVLHASAVAISGQCALFLGDKGAGKSTTAAALIERGHLLVSDDVVAIDLSEPAIPMVVPAFPQVKLTDTSASAIGMAGVSLEERRHPLIGKRQYRLPANHAVRSVPLGPIYVLERNGGKSGIVATKPGEALSLLLKFSYITRFGAIALGTSAPRHLSSCAALAGSGTVRRLRIMDGLDRLPEVSAMIERDLPQR